MYFWKKNKGELYCFKITNNGVNKRTFFNLRFLFTRVLGKFTDSVHNLTHALDPNTKTLYLYLIEITVSNGPSITSRHMAHCMDVPIHYAPRVPSTVSDKSKVSSFIWIFNLQSKTVFNHIKKYLWSPNCMLNLITLTQSKHLYLVEHLLLVETALHGIPLLVIH